VASLGPVLARCDLLVCPTTGLPAVDADQSPLGSVTIDGRAVPAHLGWVLTYPFNLLGPCPVMSIPCGRSRDGVPIGLQLVGRPHDDLTVFRVAAALEARAPWFRDQGWRPALGSPPP
jgi:Asp-tRNA(Asn)/Glu-tRNA(Gln) amidotransferase A subunit family amidase